VCICACLYVVGPVLQLALGEERLDDVVDEGVDEGVAAQREHLTDPVARAGGPRERRGAGDHRHAHPRRLLDLHRVQLLEQRAARRRLHGHRRRERQLQMSSTSNATFNLTMDATCTLCVRRAAEQSRAEARPEGPHQSLTMARRPEMVSKSWLLRELSM